MTNQVIHDCTIDTEFADYGIVRSCVINEDAENGSMVVFDRSGDITAAYPEDNVTPTIDQYNSMGRANTLAVRVHHHFNLSAAVHFGQAECKLTFMIQLKARDSHAMLQVDTALPEPFYYGCSLQGTPITCRVAYKQPNTYIDTLGVKHQYADLARISGSENFMPYEDGSANLDLHFDFMWWAKYTLVMVWRVETSKKPLTRIFHPSDFPEWEVWG